MTDGELSPDLLREAALNHRLILDHSGRRFVAVSGARWGELILPAPDETPTRSSSGLRARASHHARTGKSITAASAPRPVHVAPPPHRLRLP